MNGKTTFFIIILILLGIVGGYYIGANYKLTLQPQGAVTTTAPTPTPTPMVEVQASPSAQAVTPTIDEKGAILTAVKAGLIAEHGADAGTMTLTVSKIQGNYAQGGASAQGGGGMWLAVKTGGLWKLIWDGNGTISCASVNPYNYPNTLVPECWDDATQKSVTR